MEVKFKLDMDDAIKFYSKNVPKTKAFKKTRIHYYGGLICILLLVMILSQDNIIRIPAVIIVAFFAVFYGTLATVVYRWKLPAFFKSSEYSFMFKENILSIGEDNIIISTSIDVRKINFKTIYSLNVVDNYLVIILANFKNIIIPLNSFRNLKEKDDFFKLIEQKTDKKITNSYPIKLFI
ncbi:MAG: hypothetical protein PUE01_14820 [Clostridiaceae bacterium]|nr:hypothetical protein [Clostridiaceae bacterium]